MAHRSLCLCVLLIAATSAEAGSDPDRDVRQTVHARQALLQHPELARLNLGVSVRERVATLWGPVPSAELGLKAERVLRNLFELAAVRNELEVSDTLEAVTPAYLPNQLPATPPRPPDVAPMPSAIPETAPVRPAPALKQPAADAELPTIALPNTGALPARMPVTPEQAQGLPQAIDALFQSKDAYRSVRYSLRDRRVYLRGASHDPALLHEIAQAIARLPGVEGVFVQRADEP